MTFEITKNQQGNKKGKGQNTISALYLRLIYVPIGAHIGLLLGKISKITRTPPLFACTAKSTVLIYCLQNCLMKITRGAHQMPDIT